MRNSVVGRSQNANPMHLLVEAYDTLTWAAQLFFNEINELAPGMPCAE